MAYIEQTVSIKNVNIRFKIYPKCNFCNAVLPENLTILSEGYTSNSLGASAEHGTYFMLLKCPYCESIMLRLFGIQFDHNTNKLRDYAVEKKQHKKFKNGEFPELIHQISPRFVSVYAQAFQSEKNSLDELSGMGYRKALEILVKDYAIHKFPDEKESIMKHNFQKALAKIDTHQIKVLGQVGTKIGNDETHYYRKHDWKVSDLKNYIEGIIFFITSDVSLDEANQRLAEDRAQK